MKDRLASYGLVAASLGAVFSFGALSLLPVPLAAQEGPSSAPSAASSKPTPRTPDGHPDFSGFYNLADVYHGDPKEEKPGQHVVNRSEDGSVFFDYGGANSGEGGGEGGAKIRQTVNGKVNFLDRLCVSCENPPYKPEYMAKVKAIADAEYDATSPLDPEYDCKPYGVPRGSLRGGGGYAMQIVQNSQALAFLYEDRPGPYFRIVYLDGRPHPADLDKSYFGHSIGHWEGDTLVVDVVGLNDETWLGSGRVGPKMAMMHSDQLHVVERWSREGDVVTYEATVYDPVMFTKPWIMTPRQTQLAAPDDYIRPTMCVPYDKGHVMKGDDTPYSEVATPSSDKSPDKSEVAAASAFAKMAGNWNVTIHSTIDGILHEQWTVKQNGEKITGTVKTKSGDLTLDGSLTGAVLLATITDGEKKYEVRGTTVANDFDGTIRTGKNEFRLAAKRSQ
jgi:hypothetical protein